jgi:hypothetical protein
MRGSKHDLPVAFEGTSMVSRQAEWGDLNVALETFPIGTDPSPLFKGLPDDRCPCPHWGYVVRGRFRVRYRDREEVVNAGDAYYMPTGHVPIFEEDTEVVEFSPKVEYQAMLEVVARNLLGLQAAGTAGQAANRLIGDREDRWPGGYRPESGTR